MKILVVDDEQVALTSIRRIFRHRGYKQVDICDNGKDAIKLIRTKDYDIVLLDLLMPGLGGMEVLTSAKPFRPETEFIILTAVDDLATAVASVKKGAYDYLIKTVDPERLILSVEKAYEHKGLLAGLAGNLAHKNKKVPEIFSEIITQSPRMIELLSFAQVMAKSGNPILITGESGTGKELLARGIHRGGPFPDGPFVPVNVSSIPESLFESQFFGHVKGSFTGAQNDHPGFFCQAHGGTLFLDEIGELPFNLQAKLLRVLEDKTVTPIGETKSSSLSVRIVSATNQDLMKGCQEGTFRLDLFYRLKSADIHLPPLREREGDLPLLANYFLKRACQRHHKIIQGFHPEALQFLSQKDYPGNIRELAQIVENAVLFTETDQVLSRTLGGIPKPASLFDRQLCTLKENADTHLVYVLKKTNGDRRRAADILGISVRQVQRKVAHLNKEPRWEKIIDDI
jgi:two-component system, NtrC family, response regulator AtoC